MSSITPVGVARKNYLIKFFFPYHRLFSIAADVFYYKLVVHAALEALGSEDATDVAFRLHEILETPLISWQVYCPDIRLSHIFVDDG